MQHQWRMARVEKVPWALIRACHQTCWGREEYFEMASGEI
jgi:hypothetical protein